MFVNTVENPEDYLAHSHKQLKEREVFERYPQISQYYFDLCKEFRRVYYEQSTTFFNQFALLLGIDAQIQILLELMEVSNYKVPEEFGMTEEAIIQMIRRDKKSFYRELTGQTTLDRPKWGLIYLSEE